MPRLRDTKRMTNLSRSLSGPRGDGGCSTTRRRPGSGPGTDKGAAGETGGIGAVCSLRDGNAPA